MKDGGKESTCMTRSWRFHGKKNTSGGEISALWARSNPVSSPKTPAGCPKPRKNIFQKYPPENFQRPPRCRGGCCFCDPPIPFRKQGNLAKQKMTWS